MRHAALGLSVCACIAFLAGSLSARQQPQTGEQPSANPPAESGRQGPRGGGGQAFIERLMQSDANKDGQISWDEAPERIRERIFASADANGDKVLDKAELETLAARGPGAGPGGPGGRGRAGGETVSVHDAMEEAGRAMRSLKRSAMTAETRAADLESVQALQAALVAGKGATGTASMAPQAKTKYGEDTAAFQKDFRRSMIEAMTLSLKLETALNDGDSSAAAKARDELVAHQQTAHDAFQPPEDR